MDALAGHATALSGVGASFASTGERVNTTWQQLAPVYDAPEVGQLLAATGPVRTTSASVGEDISTVGSTLATYAATVREIKAQLESLRSQAQAFVDENGGSDDWEEDDGKVDRNNELVNAVSAQVAAFHEAQRECANTINALYGGQQYRADDGDGQASAGEYGYTTDQLNAAAGEDGALPWGSTQEHDRGLLGDVGSFFGGAWDGAKMLFGDLGSLIGRDPTTGDWSWGTAGTAWAGVGKFGLAVAMTAGNPGMIARGDSPAIPGIFAEGEASALLVGAGKSIIAYDEWGKGDNSRAAGMATFNVLSAIVGTKGAGAGLRGGGAALQASRVGAVSRAGGAMIRSGEFLGRLPTTESLAVRVSQHVPSLRLPDFGNLPDVNVPHHVDTPRVDTPSVDTPRVEARPAVANPGSVGGNLADGPGHHSADRTGPTAVPSDVPGPRGDTTPAAAVPDASPQHANAAGNGAAPDDPAHDTDTPATDREPALIGAGNDTVPIPGIGDGPADHTPGDITPDDTPGDVTAGDTTPGDGTPGDTDLGAQPDGSWVGREHGSEFTLMPEQNAAADQFLAGARDAEGQISPQVTSVADNIDGARMQGYPDFVLKGEDSLKRKLATDLAENPDLSLDEAVTGLRDSVRYTIEVPPGNYTDGVVRAVDDLRARGFENVTWKPTWDVPDSYKGVNSTWRDPTTGHIFELQFHTPDSFNAKMATHKLYEAQRVSGVSADEVARLRVEQGETFRQVDSPPGTDRLTALGDDLTRDRQPVVVGVYGTEGNASTVPPHQSEAGHAGSSNASETPREAHLGSDRGGDGGSNGRGSSGLDAGDATPPSGDGDLPRRLTNPADPHPALDSTERAALDQRQTDLTNRHPVDYDDWRLNDPAHPGREHRNQDIEAKVALDLREQGKLPEDVTRPTDSRDGDFIDPSTGKKWDIKGFHSDWPEHVSRERRYDAFPEALTPEDFRRKVTEELDLRPGERYGDRNIILNTRNLDQDAIDFMRRIVDEEGWGDRIVWYP